MRARNKFGGKISQYATLWKRGRKWNGQWGWVFAGCHLVRRQPEWSDYFRKLVTDFKSTMRTKFRVSKHKSQRSKHLRRTQSR